ncbi:MAG: hypothetical protein KGZ53_05940 [Peptococcaceae bacterium]|nr:hypothetical protein [Peptococcaceae bacterium]
MLIKLVCTLLVFTVGLMGIAPIHAGAFDVEPINQAHSEGDVSIEAWPQAWKVAATVIDWFMRLWFLNEVWQELQPRVTAVQGNTGIGHWALTGEHACDISNGIVNWR